VDNSEASTGLVVGVSGGVPRDENTNAEILLGDVIISTGVIQFDFGRQLPDQCHRRLLEDTATCRGVV
jgi:hypothetical protein